jgi:hypothetical protein
MSVQVINGAFQDILGNPIANGYIQFELSQEAFTTSTGIGMCEGFIITVQLDADGNVETSPAQFVIANDTLTPSGTFYSVSVYTANGQLVWGPNSQTVSSSPDPFSLGSWIPGSVTN